MKFKIIVLLLVMVFSLSLAGKGIEEHLQLKGPFNTPQEVTKACIECHSDVADDVLKSRHWNWLGEEATINGKKVRLGKKNILNNYCVAVSSNWARCTSCHIGYGWKDNKFDFNKKENIDCLVCHDSTGTYKKFPTGAGYPVYKVKEKFFKPKKKMFPKVDLLKIAQNVAKSSNKNCGTCHFNGGGGHNVKQGDLNKSLAKPSFEVDVHMGNPDPKKRKTCASCHQSDKKHDVKGALHSSIAGGGSNHLLCSDCHKGDKVHTKGMKSKLNKHMKTVACETCHITAVSKKYPTKVWWDWTTAGNKKKKVEKDENGKPLYSWKKGSFKWKKNLKPEYYWYNGNSDYYLLGEKIKDPKKVFTFNKLKGSMKDSNAKISPFKVMRGIQYYDPGTGFLLIPKLFGKGGYWKTLSWKDSFTKGMKSVGLSFSGKYAPIETEMYWPLDHMVAPAKKALKCNSCHVKEGKKSIMNWKKLGYKGDPKKLKFSRLKK